MANELDFEIGNMKQTLEEDLEESESSVLSLNRSTIELSPSLSTQCSLFYFPRFQNYVAFSIRELFNRENIADLCKILSESALMVSQQMVGGELIEPTSSSLVSLSALDSWFLFRKNFVKSLINVRRKVKHQIAYCIKEAEIDFRDLLKEPNSSVFAQQITQNNLYDVRIRTLNSVLSSQIYVIPDCLDPKLIINLGENLKDNDYSIFSLSLQIFAKFVSHLCLNCSVGIYYISLDSLNYYHVQISNSSSSHLPDLSAYRIANLLTLVVKVLILFMEHFTSCNSEIDVMISKFIDLLCLGAWKKSNLFNLYATPFNILSVIDPKSLWVQYLMYSKATRNIIINCLMKEPFFIQMLIMNVFEWFDKPFFPETKKMQLHSLVKKDAKFAVFFHSFMTIINIFRYRSAWKVFPLPVNELFRIKIESVSDLLLAIVNGFMQTDLSHDVKIPKRFFTLIGTRLSLLIQGEVSFYIVCEQLFKSIQPKYSHCCHLDILCGLLSYGEIHPTVISKKRLISTYRAKAEIGNSPKKNISQHQESFFCSFQSHLKLFINLLKETNVNLDYGIKMLDLSIYLLTHYDIDCVLEYIQVLFNSKGFLCRMLEHTKIYNIFRDMDLCRFNGRLINFMLLAVQKPMIVQLLSSQEIDTLVVLIFELIQTQKKFPTTCYLKHLTFILSPMPNVMSRFTQGRYFLKNDLTELWNLAEEDMALSYEIEEEIKEILCVILCTAHSLEGVKAIFSNDNDVSSTCTLVDGQLWKPTNCYELVCYGTHNNDLCECILMKVSLIALQIFVSSMDASLFLQKELNYLDSLLQIQSENINEESGEVIMDEFTILRQEIIEMSFGKKLLTDRHLYISVLKTKKGKFVWPKMDNDLYLFLKGAQVRVYDPAWSKQIRRLYKNSGCIHLKATFLIMLLEHLKKARLWQHNGNEDNIFKNVNESQNVVLSAEDILGIHQTIRYGLENDVLSNTEDICFERLSSLLQKKYLISGLHCQKFVGFDWFMATIYLIADSNIDETQRCLSLISHTPLASFLWFYNLKKNTNSTNFWQVLDELLESELPSIYIGLKSKGVSSWMICQRWAKECFWKVINWTHICQWLIFSLIYPTDYLLYFFLSIFYNYEDLILTLVEKNEVYKLLTIPNRNYEIHKYFAYMDRLHKKYNNAVYTRLGV